MTSQKKTTGRANTLRIIGGKWRGRKLQFPDEQGLRPTGDRIRETLFNWLAPSIRDARCLDLFAGSGALGLEALSRGAGHVVAIDASARVCRTLRHHRQLLAAESAMDIVLADALPWLRDHAGKPFDIVFLDPPFDSDLLVPAIECLASRSLLSAGAQIYIETSLQHDPDYPANWELLHAKHSGQVTYKLLVHEYRD